MKIIIVTEGGTQSTYEYDRLAEMWKDGLLKAETLYWKEGMTDWRPLRELFWVKSTSRTSYFNSSCKNTPTQESSFKKS